MYNYTITYTKMSSTVQQNVFCKNCDNFMDITNNISVAENASAMEGGYVYDNGLDNESSDYDVSMSEAMDGGKATLSDTNIDDVLNGSDIEFDLKNFNINDLNKNPTFNKLTNNQKTLIINRILEKIPKSKQHKHTENIGEKESYFYCKSCGYNEKIPDKQFIFSRGNEKKDDFYNYRFVNYVNDPIIPRSKNYNCINDKCPTHTNPSLKLAIFYRQKDSYNVRYICTVCNYYWNTFVAK